MKRYSNVLIVILFVLFLPAFCFAQRSEITLYAGGFLGRSFIAQPGVLFDDVQAVFDDDFTGGVRYAYFLNSHVAVEVGAGFTPASIASRASFGGSTTAKTIIDVDTWVMHANLTAHLLRGSVIPYVTGGVGAVHFSFHTSPFGFLTPSETDFALNGGGGFKFPVRQTVAIRLDGRVYWMQPEFVEGHKTFTEVTGGVSILFDF